MCSSESQKRDALRAASDRFLGRELPPEPDLRATDSHDRNSEDPDAKEAGPGVPTVSLPISEEHQLLMRAKIDRIPHLSPSLLNRKEVADLADSLADSEVVHDVVIAWHAETKAPGILASTDLRFLLLCRDERHGLIQCELLNTSITAIEQTKNVFEVTTVLVANSKRLKCYHVGEKGRVTEFVTAARGRLGLRDTLRDRVQEIKAKFESVSGSDVSIFGRKEINELPNILRDGESILDIVSGWYEGGFGVLVSTDVRLLFVDKRMLNRLRVEDFPNGVITSIQYEMTLMSGKITIHASGNRAIIGRVPKRRVRDFAEGVRSRLSRKDDPKSGPTSSSTRSVADVAKEIEALAELKAKGILSEEEFTAKKKQLLGL